MLLIGNISVENSLGKYFERLIMSGNYKSEKISISWCAILISAVVLGISLGLFEALLLVLYEKASLISVDFIVRFLAAKIGMIIAIYLLLRILVLYPLSRILKLESFALSFALLVFFMILYILYLVHSNLRLGTFPDDLRIIVLIVGVLLTALLLSMLAYSGAKLLKLSSRQAAPIAFFLVIPWILTETIAAVWLEKFLIAGNSADPAVLWKQAFSLPAIITNLGYIFVVLLTIVFSIRCVNIRRLSWLAVVFGVVLCAASVVMPYLRPTKTTLPKHLQNQEHPIKHVILIVIDTLRSDSLDTR